MLLFQTPHEFFNEHLPVKQFFGEASSERGHCRRNEKGIVTSPGCGGATRAKQDSALTKKGEEKHRQIKRCMRKMQVVADPNLYYSPLEITEGNNS